MRDIEDRLREAPREASPGEDLWPAISGKMRGVRRWPDAIRAAAAVVIFIAGGAVGAAIVTVRLQSAPGSGAISTAQTAALHTAIEIQRSGSAYLAALGRLRHIDPAQTAIRSQGYEAALAVLAAAALEVSAAADLPAAATPLAESAEQVRGAAAARVRILTTGGLE